MLRAVCVCAYAENRRAAAARWLTVTAGHAVPAGPPKIDLVDCVGMFCAACMYVGGVGRSEK
eukprot:COSAG01_NODE_44605_length_417_cov_1.116352_1_plen_61_part_01